MLQMVKALVALATLPIQHQFKPFKRTPLQKMKFQKSKLLPLMRHLSETSTKNPQLSLNLHLQMSLLKQEKKSQSLLQDSLPKCLPLANLPRNLLLNLSFLSLPPLSNLLPLPLQYLAHLPRITTSESSILRSSAELIIFLQMHVRHECMQR